VEDEFALFIIEHDDDSDAMKSMPPAPRCQRAYFTIDVDSSRPCMIYVPRKAHVETAFVDR